MAIAFIITLDKDLPDASAAYTKAKTGKAIAREADKLDSVCRRKSVTTLTSLLSESQTALIAQLTADGFDPSKMRLPPEQWFTADEGRKSIAAMIEYVSANLNDFKQPNPILRDLKAADALLAVAESAGVKFHFTKADL